MLRIDAAERREELPALDLQIPRQRGRLHERLLHLQRGLVGVIELEDDVREPLEIRVHRAVERQLRIARVEAALLRIVVADFEPIEMLLGRDRSREHPVEGDVQVILPAARDRDRCSERRAAHVRLAGRYRGVGRWKCGRAWRGSAGRWTRGIPEHRGVGGGKERAALRRGCCAIRSRHRWRGAGDRLLEVIDHLLLRLDARLERVDLLLMLRLHLLDAGLHFEHLLF